MAFSPAIAEKLLVACHRHCCICHKPAGTKMEIHHIVPRERGGGGNEDNGIPLCLDCHAEVAAYNPNHPKGRQFTPAELRKHKEQWFTICQKPPWDVAVIRDYIDPPELDVINEDIFANLRMDDRRPAQNLVGAFERLERPSRKAFATRVFKGLQEESEETRWKVSMLVEELVLWEPNLVPPEILENMSRDSCFAVRSSAAMCYYYIARLSPASVPLDVLSSLASYEEDWYVCTPAVSALLRLARTRPVVMDIFEWDLRHKEKYVREHAAAAIKRLAETEPELVSVDLLKRMVKSKDPFVKEVGLKGLEFNKKAKRKQFKDYSAF
jgi:predicted nucleic acid-binding protein